MSTALVVLVAFQTVALVVVVAGFVVYLHRRDAREQDERRELLNRIQHPQLMPVKASPLPAVDAPAHLQEPDEMDFAGTVRAEDPS